MAQIHDDFNDMMANLPEGHTAKNKAGMAHIDAWFAARGIAPEDRAAIKKTARDIRAQRSAREVQKQAAVETNAQLLDDHLASSPSGQARVDYEHPIHGWTSTMMPVHAVQPFLQQHSGSDVTVTVGTFPGTARMLNLTTGSGRAINPSHPTGGRIPVGTLPGSEKEKRAAVSKPTDTVVEVPSLGPALIPGIGRQIRAGVTRSQYRSNLTAAQNRTVTPAPEELQKLGQGVNQARDFAVRAGGPLVVEPERIDRPGEIHPGAIIRMAEGLGRDIHGERMGSDAEYREAVNTTANEAAAKQEAVSTARNRLVAHEQKQATPLYYGGGGRNTLFGGYSDYAKDLMNAGASVPRDTSAELAREGRYLDSRGEQHVFPAEMTTKERGLKAVYALAQGIAAGGNGAEHLRHAEGLMNVDLAGQMVGPNYIPRLDTFGGKPGYHPAAGAVQEQIEQGFSKLSPEDQQASMDATIQARAHWITAQHPMYRGLLEDPTRLGETARVYGAPASASAAPGAVLAAAEAGGALKKPAPVRMAPSTKMIGYQKSTSKNHPKGYIEPTREEAEFAAQQTGYVPKTHPVQESPFIGRFLDRARGDIAQEIQQRAATHAINASIDADNAIASAQTQTQRRSRKR